MDYDKSNTSFISTVVWTFGLAALTARASVAGCDHTRDRGMDRRQLIARGREPPRPAKEPCSRYPRANVRRDGAAAARMPRRKVLSPSNKQDGD